MIFLFTLLFSTEIKIYYDQSQKFIHAGKNTFLIEPCLQDNYFCSKFGENNTFLAKPMSLYYQYKKYFFLYIIFLFSYWSNTLLPQRGKKVLFS